MICTAIIPKNPIPNLLHDKKKQLTNPYLTKTKNKQEKKWVTKKKNLLEFLALTYGG